MRDAIEVLFYHEQRHSESCVAWGLEFILKVREKIGLDEYPLQSGIEPNTGIGSCSWGFGQKERDFISYKYNIILEEKEFEFQEFEDEMKIESQAGRFPIFPLPISVALNFYPAGFGEFTSHICVAVLQQNQLKYWTRQCGSRTILDIPVQLFYNFLRSRIKSDYRIHCLLHR